ncbi:unnamed protein product [Clonostachys byssicola]|uniref:Uncharacterized protein n=1 Tax=Clonostachys byssicola TaxID=160290 RepID=A0A9N9XZX5_9HYPO|nr:unnamed protein product [Clonostachys byssicola]
MSIPRTISRKLEESPARSGEDMLDRENIDIRGGQERGDRACRKALIRTGRESARSKGHGASLEFPPPLKLAHNSPRRYYVVQW